MRVLIAFPRRENDLAFAVADELRMRAEARGTPIELISQVTTAQEANDALNNATFGAIIVHEHLPERGDSVHSSSLGGMNFILSLRKKQNTIRAALLHSKSMWNEIERAQIELWGDTKDIRHSMDAIAQLAEYALSAKVPSPRIDISVHISKPPEPWKYFITGQNCPISPSEGLLHLRPDQVGVLKALSRDIDQDDDGDSDEWQDRLKLLSDSLWGCLIEGQNQFSSDLDRAFEKIPRIEDTRLRFSIDPDNYSVAFEAIRHPKGPFPYWMLGAPVYRSIRVDSKLSGRALGRADETRPLNCLIVLADADGKVTYPSRDGPSRKFLYESLPEARRECEALFAFFEETRAAGGNIGKVVFAGKQGPLTVGDLRSLLMTDCADDGRAWDLIHYAGHTDFIDDRAYVILPGKAAGTAEAAELKDLAPLFGNSRFVYLSSCYSASADFVFRLAGHGVPGILGFRTRIEDELAIQHATRFYSEFFETQSFENAFLRTRRHFYAQELRSRVWARASLILQN